MAEVNITRTRLSQIAGAKAPAASLNRVRVAVIEMPAAYAAPANGDTAGTELCLPIGARLLLPVTVSCAAGNAASTLSVGLRDYKTKTAIDATGVVNAAAISGAATAQFNTGTKTINGQTYLMPSESVELYLTFGGAAGLANQAIRIEVPFVAP